MAFAMPIAIKTADTSSVALIGSPNEREARAIPISGVAKTRKEVVTAGRLWLTLNIASREAQRRQCRHRQAGARA